MLSSFFPGKPQYRHWILRDMQPDSKILPVTALQGAHIKGKEMS